MWNCVQTEDEGEAPHAGRIRRKLLFGKIAAELEYGDEKRLKDPCFPTNDDETYQYGSKVYYYDNCEQTSVREARFVGSSNSLALGPREIIVQLLNSEYELAQFCGENKLPDSNSLIEMAILAYDFIRDKLEKKEVEMQEVPQAAVTAPAAATPPTEQPPTEEEEQVLAVEQHAVEETVTEEEQQEQQTGELASSSKELEEQHIQIQVPAQVVQQSQSPQQIIQQSQQTFLQTGLQSPRAQQLFMHNSQLYAIVPNQGGGLSQGIPLQIAKPDKQSETRAFRNGVQNIQITDGGQSYEIIQKSDADEHEETQQVVQMEEQFEERVTWGDDVNPHVQAQNLEVTREETIETDLDQSQPAGQQEATIAVSSSGVHQTLGAYSNQITPTTLLLSTNHLGQTQVIPLSTINDPWNGPNVQQIMYPVTTVINQGETGQIAKMTSPNGQSVQLQQSPTQKQSTRYSSGGGGSSTKRSTTKKSGTPGSTRKKRTWKSLVLPPEKIPISPNGTWEKPILERIAPGQNYKDMRTWVFYLSVQGKLFKAVVEKILHEKKTAYLTCSNAKKKALQEKCKWRGRLYMRDPLLNPDTEEFADLNNWSVVEVKNYHKHRHENCYVEGIKHYNTQNAKRCRVQRGQVIAVHDGVVKDISKMPPDEQERILALSTQSDRPSSLSITQMRAIKQKQQQQSQALAMQQANAQIIQQQQSDQIQLVVTTLPGQGAPEEITLEQSSMDEESGEAESRMDLAEEVVEEEGIVEQAAVQRDTVSAETEFELTSVDGMKTEHADDREPDDEVPPLENAQEDMK